MTVEPASETGRDDVEPEVAETVATYYRLRGMRPSARGARRKRRGPIDDENAPFAPGRDPKGLGDIMSALTKEAGWNPQLAREDIVSNWAEVAGDNTAAHTRPVSHNDGLLTIQCDSTAWAHELQRMRAQILTELLRRYPDAGVERIRFVGPDVPSWKWGPRSVSGRGPRDTYG